MNDKKCLCFYPCDSDSCPKIKDSVCHPFICRTIGKYVELTSNKKYCSECGRKLK